MGQTRRGFLAILAGALIAAQAIFGPAPAAAQQTGPLVFAAASLTNALGAINSQWEKETGKKAVFSFAASSALAKQMEAGAPADIFISADLDWMAYAADKGLIRKDSEVRLLGNRLVLVAPKDSTVTASITQGFDLAALLGDGRLAVGAVESVPAGKYAKASLQALGSWDGVKDKLAQAESVRAALALVARAEAPLGIVYETDAVAETAVRIVAAFPDDSHPPIVYPAAITSASTNPDTAAFFAFLRTPAAGKVFKAAGFTVLD